MSRIFSFPPVEDPDVRILILGSMPGKASLEANQYYAHPRNAFWGIIGDLFDIPAETRYPDRLQVLTKNHIALWDVMQCCIRESSLDADIVEDSIEANHFQGFLDEHPSIDHIYFNGAKAEHAYHRYVLPNLNVDQTSIPTTRLPSTSPAHAAMTYTQKLEVWRRVVQ
ncbi:MAG: DNA-deoxyinosine glycosylase [Candidatus Hydrogenedentota bacterium]